MSKNKMTFASFVAPASTAHYPTATNWFTKRAYAHFGNSFGKRPIGANG